MAQLTLIMIHQMIRAIIYSVGIAVFAWLIFRLIRARFVPWQGRRESWLIVLVAYLAVVAAVTILPLSVSAFKNLHARGLNLLPVLNTYHQFATDIRVRDQRALLFALENIIGNLLLFVPLGFLLPKLWNQWRKPFRVFLLALLCSIGIEGIQYAWGFFGTYRMVDIDDVLLNTAGAMVGYLLFRFFESRLTSNKITHSRSHEANT